MRDHTTPLKKLFKETFNEEATGVLPLRAHASQREIYRLLSNERSVVGVFNPILQENKAFIEFSKHFLRHGLPVPEIYAADPAGEFYLEQDLGDHTLMDILTRERAGSEQFPIQCIPLLKKIVEILPIFQIKAGKDLDYSLCYPEYAYGREAMIRDMAAFRDDFLSHTSISFSANKLEKDFQMFSDFLLEADASHFMYRDFQSRNIMIREDSVFFIDYQSGRKGALQYDIASFLYQSKADIPEEIRKGLLDIYLRSVESLVTLDRHRFIKYFDGFVLIRLMQVLATYGKQGLSLGKQYFRESIPYAIRNLKGKLGGNSFPAGFKIPELTNVLGEIVSKYEDGCLFASNTNNPLSVRIASFSYRDGKVPEDAAGNGGGFVFDCRCVQNPGREERFKKRTGLDSDVQKHLDTIPEAKKFLEEVAGLIRLAIESYKAKGYRDLMISFGCTGGQHRSVFFAERLGEVLRKDPSLVVSVSHTQIPLLKLP